MLILLTGPVRELPPRLSFIMILVNIASSPSPTIALVSMADVSVLCFFVYLHGLHVITVLQFCHNEFEGDLGVYLSAWLHGLYRIRVAS